MHGLHSMLDIKRYNNVGVDSEFSSKIIYIYKLRATGRDI